MAETKYPFLSEEWIEEARKLQEELAAGAGEAGGGEAGEADTEAGGEGAAEDGGAPAPGVGSGPQSIRMNLIVTGVPFGEESLDAHLDTTSGVIKLDLGHLEDPELTVTLDYHTSKAILVDGDFQTGIQAFMSGKIKVEGDMSKILALQSGPADPQAAELASRMKEITADA